MSGREVGSAVVWALLWGPIWVALALALIHVGSARPQQPPTVGHLSTTVLPTCTAS